MNDQEAPLLKETLRTTALMLVPIAAFLAILSAVALFAIPTSNPQPKEQRVDVQGASSPDDKQPSTPSRGSRAIVKPQNKI